MADTAIYACSLLIYRWISCSASSQLTINRCYNNKVTLIWQNYFTDSELSSSEDSPFLIYLILECLRYQEQHASSVPADYSSKQQAAEKKMGYEPIRYSPSEGEREVATTLFLCFVSLTFLFLFFRFNPRKLSSTTNRLRHTCTCT